MITKRNIALKRVCKPSFKRSMTLHEDLVIIQTAITNLKLNKPIYVGASVLDLSKLHMYKFHYEEMLPRYSKIHLCFTDTDSLLYEIETPDIYADMAENTSAYDFSEYPVDHALYSLTNKKVIGKFKDELHGQILLEFCGLRPKCYSLLYLILGGDFGEKQTAKGTKTSVRKAFLRHVHFKTSLNELSTVTVRQNTIQSKHHVLRSMHQTKVALTAFDTKRWICDDNIHTRAYGHIGNYGVGVDWDSDFDI